MALFSYKKKYGIVQCIIYFRKWFPIGSKRAKFGKKDKLVHSLAHVDQTLRV